MKHFYNMTMLPIALYENQTITLSFCSYPITEHPAVHMLESHFNSDIKALCIYWSDNIVCGYVHISPDSYLLLGPQIRNTLSEKEMMRFISSIHIDPELFPEMDLFFSSTNQLSFYNFTDALSTLSYIFFDEVDIKIHHFSHHFSKADYVSPENYTPLTPSNNLAYQYAENTIVNCIETGQPRKLMDFLLKLDNLDLKAGRMAESELRSLKNVFISSSAIGRHVMINAGISPGKANEMTNLYTQKLESMNDKEAINLLLYKMFIDYAKQVEALNKSNISNVVVLKTISYIQEHLYEKISLSTIAKQLKYSPEHIERTFHKEMNLTVHNYIQIQKIEVAKQLLLFSDYSLLEISETLCFSSQSHFQKVFLKIVNDTPIHFRKMNRI